MPTDDEFLDTLAAALATVHHTPPADRIAALRVAAAHRSETTDVKPIGSRGARRARSTLAIAAAAAVAFALGGVVFRGDDSGDSLLAGGVVEFKTTLLAASGGATAAVTGIRTGIGRTVQLRTDELPILPKGDLYEVWFVGRGDTPRTPNRISAGTFHPDDKGRSHVDLTAAVDPALYPALVVTAEPGDGNPASTGPEVLRAVIVVLESSRQASGASS